jgi:hypothetical protein
MKQIILVVTGAILFSACTNSQLKVKLENGAFVYAENPKNYKYLAGDTVAVRKVYLAQTQDDSDWSISNDGIHNDLILPDKVYKIGVVQ